MGRDGERQSTMKGRTGSQTHRRRLGLVGCALFVLSCDDLSVTYLQFSTWGGTHIGLIITVSGANVEYDCAEGEILEPIRVVNGRFNVLGLHYFGVGGPIGVDRAHPRPARFEGLVKGDKMTMTVTLTDKMEPVGTFELVQGANPHVMKCL